MSKKHNHQPPSIVIDEAAFIPAYDEKAPKLDHLQGTEWQGYLLFENGEGTRYVRVLVPYELIQDIQVQPIVEPNLRNYQAQKIASDIQSDAFTLKRDWQR